MLLLLSSWEVVANTAKKVLNIHLCRAVYRIGLLNENTGTGKNWSFCLSLQLCLSLCQGRQRVSNKRFGIGCAKRYQLKQEAMILYFAALKATKEKLSIVQVETIVMDIERIWRHVWAELWFWNTNACQISKL